MKNTKTIRTPEEKAKLLAQVEELRTTENLSILEACKKAGINGSNYFQWGRKQKVKKTRRKQQPELVTALVTRTATPVGPELPRFHFGENTTPDQMNQVAQMAGTMMGSMLKTLFSGGPLK